MRRKAWSERIDAAEQRGTFTGHDIVKIGRWLHEGGNPLALRNWALKQGGT